MRPAVVRFYFDADILGLAHTVCRLRNDCTYPGDPGAVIRGRIRPPCPITGPATADSVWIPLVADRGWVAITRDAKISRRPWETQTLLAHSAKHVTISGSEGTGVWAQLEILMRNWRAIDRLWEETGPYMYTATRSRLTKLRST